MNQAYTGGTVPMPTPGDESMVKIAVLTTEAYERNRQAFLKSIFLPGTADVETEMKRRRDFGIIDDGGGE